MKKLPSLHLFFSIYSNSIKNNIYTVVGLKYLDQEKQSKLCVKGKYSDSTLQQLFTIYRLLNP